MKKILPTIISVTLLLTACSAPIPAPTVTPFPSITPSPTVIPTATTVAPTPTEATPKFSMDSLGLSPELAIALKKHAGLEASITPEDDKFTTSITYWDSDHKLVTEKVDIDPTQLTEDINSKNMFGNTPMVFTSDGQKIYWAQEHKAWFKAEMSADINKPVFIPYEYRDVALRAVIAEFNQPFSQDALDWFKKTLEQGIQLEFVFLEVNANTHEGTTFSYIRNTAMGDNARTVSNSPVQVIDAWFVTQLPDGTSYQYFPTKWLDPMDPRNPNGDEWKILFAASGQEVMGDAGNRAQFAKLLKQVSDPKSGLEVLTIISAQSNFFNDTNGMITLGATQPSLAKLATEADAYFGNLPIPTIPQEKFRVWIDRQLEKLSLSNTVLGFGWTTKNDPEYNLSFLPPETQTVLYPALITLR